MKPEGQDNALQAIKQFAKAIDRTDALIHDASRAQKSQDVRKYCNNIGTILQALEKNISRANKAELYIGIIKETV